MKKPSAIMLTVVIVLVVLGLWYAKFQFDLCYPEVSNSIWYCIQHAS